MPYKLAMGMWLLLPLCKIKNMQSYIKNFNDFLENVYSVWKKVDIKYLEEQKSVIDSHRPFSKTALKSLEEKLEVDDVHNSTAIEGNTLTLGETGLVLAKGVTVGGKSLKDHLEVTSYDKAYHYIKSTYDAIGKIDEKIILEIHRLVFADFTKELKEQLDYGIGTYRQQAVFIKGSSYVPPNYVKVPELMEVFLEFLAEIKKDDLRKAIIAHLGLVTIHPFVDGNGRAARLFMNLVMLKAGWPIIVVKEARRADYLNSLEAIQVDPSDKKFFILMLEFLQEGLNLYKEL